MNVFLAGTTVKVTVPLVTKRGEALTPSAVSYRLLDEKDAEVFPLTAVPGYVPGSTVDLEIDALLNELALNESRGVRQIELTMVDELGNTHQSSSYYGIEGSDLLVAGGNSIQTYAQALMTAQSMPDVAGWDDATESDRLRALLEAKLKLYALNFRPYIGVIGQDNEQFGAPSTVATSFATSDPISVTTSLEYLKPEQFAQLPVRFLSALRRAQIAQANDQLSFDTVARAREQGLISDQVGETKQVFKTDGVGPLRMIVCKRALQYLAGFVVFNPRIGRR